MAGTSLTSAGAGADLDAGERRVDHAMQATEPLFFRDYSVDGGQVAGDGGAGMTDGDPRARSAIHSDSHVVQAWPGRAVPS
jgi:hypothetical protein